MANLSEQAIWEAGIYQWAATDVVQGGPDGIDNVPTGQLANRTLYLKQAVEARAPIASPVLTGTPTAPTAAHGTDTNQLATTSFVVEAITALLNAPPATLDTLNEIAAALGDDPNFAASVTAQIALKANRASPALTGVPTAPTAPNGTSTQQLATTAFVSNAVIEEIGQSKALSNVQQVKYSVRTTLNGVSGYQPVLSATYIKKSPTSNLVFFVSSPTYVGGATGPSLSRLTLGGTENDAVLSNNDPSQAKGQTAFNGIVSGLGPGNQAWAYWLGRGDGSAWGASFNPSSLDAGYLPASGTETTIIIGEIEP